MKQYKYQKTWTDPCTNKRCVVRADDEETLWKKYFEKRYGEKIAPAPAPSIFTVGEWSEEVTGVLHQRLL